MQHINTNESEACESQETKYTNRQWSKHTRRQNSDPQPPAIPYLQETGPKQVTPLSFVTIQKATQ